MAAGLFAVAATEERPGRVLVSYDAFDELA